VAQGRDAVNERVRFVVGIEDHPLRLAGIGPDEQHPTMTQANMGNLHRGRDTIDENDLMAQVELVGDTA